MSLIDRKDLSQVTSEVVETPEPSVTLSEIESMLSEIGSQTLRDLFLSPDDGSHPNHLSEILTGHSIPESYVRRFGENITLLGNFAKLLEEKSGQKIKVDIRLNIDLEHLLRNIDRAKRYSH